MKKLIRILLLILLCGVLISLAGAFALALYYQNNFPVNTWINGVYCTGKTIEEVNAELVEQTKLPVLTIEDADGQIWELSLEEAELCPDYRKALKGYLYENATYRWMQNLDKPVSATLDKVIYTWNSEKLKAMFEALAPVQKEAGRRIGVEVNFSEDDGYVLYDGNTQRLNTEKAFSYLESCISVGIVHVNLAQGNCYEDLEDNERDKAARVLWKQLEEFFACNLVYDMGAEQIPLSSDIISRFLTVEGENIVLNPDGIDAFVTELAADYDTVKTTRKFASTRGDTVEVPYVTYGTKLDTKAEVKWLTENFWENRQMRAEPEYHIPAYKQEGFARGLNDIGDTYIEIDMTMQHMYYYVDGEIALETDVVTGNTGRRMGTPEGINFVYNKQRNRVLKGPGYASPVKYWVPVKGAVGIHDANWRSEFGGEIYKKNGSHGCINTPTDKMKELYEMVEIGTPVVMFY